MPDGSQTRYHRRGLAAIPEAPIVDGGLDARQEWHGALGKLGIGEHRGTRVAHPCLRYASRDAVGLIIGNVYWFVHVAQLVVSRYAKPHKLLRAEPLALKLWEGKLTQHLGAKHFLHVAHDVIAIAYVDGVAVHMFLRQPRAYHLFGVQCHIKPGNTSKRFVITDSLPILCHYLQGIVCEQIIAVGYEKQLAMRTLRTNVYRHVLAAIGLINIAHGEGITTFFFKVCHDLMRVVGRPVVHDNPLKILVGLTAKTVI